MSFVQNNRLPLTETVDLNYDTSNAEACEDGDGTYDMHWYKVNLPADKLYLLKWKLAAFGSRPGSTSPENPFFNFTVAEGKVGIDPTNSAGERVEQHDLRLLQHELREGRVRAPTILAPAAT